MEDKSNVKTFCSKNILAILGFSSIIAVIALLAVGLTQNKALPENVKVSQICVCVCMYVRGDLGGTDPPVRGRRVKVCRA
uniref:Uncharacterized protein n=1 Tax=Nomascus leucogenys TaxID=61853 RepID=A0A2I3GPF0_NOMLE